MYRCCGGLRLTIRASSLLIVGHRYTGSRGHHEPTVHDTLLSGNYQLQTWVMGAYLEVYSPWTSI